MINREILIFRNKYNKNGPIHPIHGQCWIWTSAKLKSGYGRHKGVLAHRYCWEMYNGQIPEGMSVLHKCDNPSCVNHNHLFVGTQQDNLEDMRLKGHQVRGEKQGSSKLTSDQIIEIRSRYRRYSHKHGSGALAREYGVGLVQIWRIVNDKQWRHI